MKSSNLGIVSLSLLIALFSSCSILSWTFTGFTNGTGKIKEYNFYNCSFSELYQSIEQFKKRNPVYFSPPPSFNKNLLIHGYRDTLTVEAKHFNSDTFNTHLFFSHENEQIAFWLKHHGHADFDNKGLTWISIKGISINGSIFYTEQYVDRNRSFRKSKLPNYLQLIDEKFISKVIANCNNCKPCK